MTTARFLTDTSAIVRLARYPEVRGSWHTQFTNGHLGICSITELEMFHTARSKDDRTALHMSIGEIYSWVLMPDRVFQRAREVQEALIDNGTHRSAGPVDLLVAATAELHNLTLLHYDADFTAVTEVTGQPVEWIAEPGSVD